MATFLFGTPIDDPVAYVDGLLILARDALEDPTAAHDEIMNAEELLAADRNELIAAMKQEATMLSQEAPRRRSMQSDPRSTA